MIIIIMKKSAAFMFHAELATSYMAKIIENIPYWPRRRLLFISH